MSESHPKFQIIEDDPWLAPYYHEIQNRHQRFLDKKNEITKVHGTLSDFADAYKYLGLHYSAQKKGWIYREWAPEAFGLYLVGDFNNWDREANPLTKNEKGIWEIILPDSEYADKLKINSFIKVHVIGHNGAHDRISPYIFKTYQDDATKIFTGVVWDINSPFAWSDEKFIPINAKKMPVIYEAHIGMAQEKEGVGTYVEFADNILPRIKNLGYNTVQLMGVAEHPYYGSFGYHVSNYYAPSSRFGSPTDLKYLVNKAHSLGIAVIMDIVHSHAVKNFDEGLNYFDGTDYQYFHSGGKGYHEQWDSMLFDYGKWEVKQFLLSNLKYWLSEFHFDGFRFDGVTSIYYYHHGNFVSFDHYDKYFKDGVDWDAVTYLQLANDLVHTLKPETLTICEDMSGMPGGCRNINEGGIGFDYRLGMGIPDYWIKLLKHSQDEDWNIHEIYNMLVNRRWKEKTVSYAESHDQALVGDKTVAFWLMDKEMYWHMKDDDDNIIIERGIALHKMIRFVTMVLGGEAYMNFLGNEFGHPEWIDFPREGNNWSYKYCKRQWSLVDNERLKYKYMNNWDKDMLALCNKYELLNSWGAHPLNMDNDNKVIVAERKNLIFVFNFSPHKSIFDYRFYVPQAGKYKIILNSDARHYGGHGRIDSSIEHITQLQNDSHILSIYLTNRTALVLEKID
ncbi:MAG: alpha amylase C-terminal domain-containing protein [Cytophagales bacterium]|nr:alpha amylase C-terminal domain-containing protein [Cytophagales bacterium]